MLQGRPKVIARKFVLLAPAGSETPAQIFTRYMQAVSESQVEEGIFPPLGQAIALHSAGVITLDVWSVGGEPK